jgi:hypothetical protein
MGGYFVNKEENQMKYIYKNARLPVYLTQFKRGLDILIVEPNQPIELSVDEVAGFQEAMKEYGFKGELVAHVEPKAEPKVEPKAEEKPKAKGK